MGPETLQPLPNPSPEPARALVDPPANTASAIAFEQTMDRTAPMPRTPPPAAAPVVAVPASVRQNARELASSSQALVLAMYLNAHFPPTAQVAPGIDADSGIVQPANPGIYIPEFFGYPPPSERSAAGVFEFYHLRFVNTKTGQDVAKGLNVGLIIDKFSRYPMSPGYVLGEIAREVGTLVEAQP